MNHIGLQVAVLYSAYHPCGDGFTCKPITHEGLDITVKDDLPM
jgi:hypothetical protein